MFIIKIEKIFNKFFIINGKKMSNNFEKKTLKNICLKYVYENLKPKIFTEKKIVSYHTFYLIIKFGTLKKTIIDLKSIIKDLKEQKKNNIKTLRNNFVSVIDDRDIRVFYYCKYLYLNYNFENNLSNMFLKKIDNNLKEYLLKYDYLLDFDILKVLILKNNEEKFYEYLDYFHKKSNSKSIIKEIKERLDDDGISYFYRDPFDDNGVEIRDGINLYDRLSDNFKKELKILEKK